MNDGERQRAQLCTRMLENSGPEFDGATFRINLDSELTWQGRRAVQLYKAFVL
jgi:hypothetical protein